MKTFKVVQILVAAGLVCACSDNGDGEGSFETSPVDAETLKGIIAEAASTDRRVMRDISAMGHVDPSLIIEEYGETLTCHTIILTIAQPKPGENRFIELSETASPAELSEALHAPSGGSVCSILYPEYIRDLEWEHEGLKIEGRFTFEATNKAYKGQAAFTAVSESGRNEDIYVSSFILHSEGLRLDRKDKNAKWLRSQIAD